MRKGACLLDTGPLVSYLAAGSRHHKWAVQQWEQLSPPLLLANASLVRLSEIHVVSEVLTLDSDFRIYRRYGNKVIPVRMPD